VWSSVALGLSEHDVLYNCLPLYHSSALMLGTGSVVSAGATMALARRFSRTRFWDDICDHGATSFVYIGELCRYLAGAPESPRDREHRVRVITGNGLQHDVWRVIQARFGISRISEFYGATEGNCITLNVLNVRGSVGPMLPNMVLASWDEDAQDFVRDGRGFLIKAKAGERGVLLGRIDGRRTRFDGYRDASATDGKIVRNAFRTGDAYFNSGDVLRLDRRHHLYFVDRVGDTFRWKGENVSTGEVQQQIAAWPPAAVAAVYGVCIPGTEGRAGMLSLCLREGHRFDADAFKAHIDARLASYARPLFVRLMPAMNVTGTLKVRTVALQKEGFDPTEITDPIYFCHPGRDCYVPLDGELHAEIVAGRLPL
jgi:acyl-CoA synthetase (AMP-forming)/AMP-acid ligase II